MQELFGPVEKVVDHAALTLPGEVPPDLEAKQVLEIAEFDGPRHEVVDLSLTNQEVQNDALDEVLLGIVPAGCTSVDFWIVSAADLVDGQLDLGEDFGSDPRRTVLDTELYEGHRSAPIFSFSTISLYGSWHE
jgi:hypothetical protein